MALARAFTNLGNLIIRTLGDTGGPPSDRVSQELDNLVNWAKTSPRRIHFNTSSVGNVGAGLDVLHTFSLDTPNRLLVDGDELNVVYGGAFASNDTDKRVNAFFDGTAYETVGTQDIDGPIGWRIQATIIRLSSTSVRINHHLAIGFLLGDSATPPNMSTAGVSALLISRSNDIGTANLNSNAITMECKGEGAANNDVVQNMSSIYLTLQ